MNGAPSLLRGRWPAIALVASLVLNGFLVGMLVAGSLRPHRSDGPRIVNYELRRLAERLPSDAVDRVAADLEPLAPRLEERIDKIRAIREEINQMAAAPTPDRAAIDRLFAELREEVARLQEEVQRATFDSLLELPAETRQSLAERPPSG